MSFTSVLQHIGSALKTIFTFGTQVAAIAQPIITVAAPGISALYNTTLTEVIKAESLAAAAGATQGTGAQKLAAVLTAITPVATEYFQSQGIKVDSTVLTNWTNAVVASLNAIPAPNLVAAPPAA